MMAQWYLSMGCGALELPCALIILRAEVVFSACGALVLFVISAPADGRDFFVWIAVVVR